MAQQNKFDIVISAVDGASKPIAKINRNLEKMLRPMKQLERSAKSLGKELHLDKAGRGVAGIAKMAEKFGISSPLMAGAAGGFGAAALVAMMAKMEANLGAAGSRVSRLGARTGVSGGVIQRYRGAAKLLGLNSESVDGGLSSLSDTMRNAQFDPQLAMLFQKLGVKPTMKADGTPNVGAMLPKLADAVAAQKNPATAAAILNQLGIGDLFPLLRGGAKTLEDFASKAEKAGMVLEDDTVKSATEFDRSVDLLKGNLDGLTNQVGKELMPAFRSGIDFINDRFKKDQENPGKDPGFLEHPLSPFKMLSDAMQLGEAMGSPDWVDPANGRRFSGRVVNERGLGQSFKLNNPGNLRNPGGAGFQRFMSSQQGLQAMAGQLGLYYNRDHLDTIGGIVSKYAPPKVNDTVENDTAAYIANVSKRTGFGANQQLNLNDPAQLQAVMQAMLVQEQGKAAAGINSQELAQAIAAALKGVTLNAKVHGGNGSRVAFAMPTDGVR
jgi:hypothetical protein